MSVLGRRPLRESRLSLVGIKGGRRKMVRGVGGGRKERNRKRERLPLPSLSPIPLPFYLPPISTLATQATLTPSLV